MMHLEGPWMTTTKYSKKPHAKWASAEAKQRAAQQAQEWQALQQTWDKLAPRFATKSYPAQQMPRGAFRPLQSAPMYPPGREPQAIPSRDSGIGVAARPADKVYTGSSVVGIVVQHKSCLQPVFSSDEAKDSAKMRR